MQLLLHLAWVERPCPCSTGRNPAVGLSGLSYRPRQTSGFSAELPAMWCAIFCSRFWQVT